MRLAAFFIVFQCACGPLQLPPDPLPPDPIELGDIPKPSIGSSKLVLITHGWNSQADDGWPEEMGMNIANLVDTADWTVDWYDWREDATGLPPSVAVRAVEHGYWLGQHLAPQGWSHIHFIGHSAGSWLVEQAAMAIREHADSEPTIHITFLDAYVPQGSFYHANLLGQNADWADHYFTEDATGIFTQITLPHAHNVNLNAIETLEGLGHSFPHRWYCASINSLYPPDVAPACEDWHGEPGEPYGFDVYGFVRSLEGGGQGEWAQNSEDGGYTVCNQQNPPCVAAVEIAAVIEGNHSWRDGLSFESDDGTAVYDDHGVHLQTRSHVWTSTLLNASGNPNYVRFNYEFVGDNEGFLSVHINNQLVHMADQRVAGHQSRDSGIIIVPGELAEYNWVTVRLDPLRDGQAGITVSDIEYGIVHSASE